MTKILISSFLLAVSTLTTACSDGKPHSNEAKQAEVKLPETGIKDAQNSELQKRKERASQKGNGLDSYDPNNLPVAPKKAQEKPKKSGNGLDSYNPDGN